MVHKITASWKNVRKLATACITCRNFILEDNLGMIQCGIIGVCKLFPNDPESGILTKYSIAPPCAVWSYERS